MAFTSDVSISPDGYSTDHQMLGSIWAWMIVINSNLYIMMNTSSWNILVVAGWVLTMIAWFAFIGVFWTTWGSPAYGMFYILTEPVFWCVWLLASVVAFLPRFTWAYIKSAEKPVDMDIAREIWKYKIASPILDGDDVWSNDDLDALYTRVSVVEPVDQNLKSFDIISHADSCKPELRKRSVVFLNEPTLPVAWRGYSFGDAGRFDEIVSEQNDNECID